MVRHRQEAVWQETVQGLDLIVHATLCAIAVVAMAALVPAIAAAEPPGRAPYERALELYFSRPEEDSAFLRRYEPVVTVRLTGEFTPETQVTLYRDGKDVVATRIRVGQGRSLEEQITALGLGAAEITDEKLRNAITSERRTLSSHDCPELENRLETLAALRAPLVPETAFYQPATTYQIWMTGLLEERYLRLVGPAWESVGVAHWGPRVPPSAELIEWCRSLVTLFDKPSCVE